MMYDIEGNGIPEQLKSEREESERQIREQEINKLYPDSMEYLYIHARNSQN